MDRTHGVALVTAVDVLRTDTAVLEAQAVCVLGIGRENVSRPIAALTASTGESVTVVAIAGSHEEQLVDAVTEKNSGDSVVV